MKTARAVVAVFILALGLSTPGQLFAQSAPALPRRSGTIDIPPRTWVARTWNKAGAPGSGGGAKHLRLMQNPDNGRIYFNGGDIAGPYQGNTQGLWSYDIAKDEWREDYPSCGHEGEILAGGPDEVGWVWDSTRHKFWSLPGFYFLNQSGPVSCGRQSTWNTATPLVIDRVDNYPNGGFYFLFDSNGDRHLGKYSVTPHDPSNGFTTIRNLGGLPSSVTAYYAAKGKGYLVGGILNFDPATNKWSMPNAPSSPLQSQQPKNAVYDPQTDSIWQAGDDAGGISFVQFHIGSNKWDKYGVACAIPDPGAYGSPGSCPPGRYYINNVGLGFEYLAADLAHRKIYVIDAYFGRLLQFDMDTHVIRIKADPPFDTATKALLRAGKVNLHDTTNPVFDSVNGVLLYPFLPNGLDGHPKLFIYHPDTNSWEIDSMYQPQGRMVRGNSFAFDAVNNVLLSIGGLIHGDLDPTVTHFFLYRYGTGSGAPIRPDRR